MQRVLRWLGWILGAFFLLTTLAVLVTRWVDPPTTAFILGSRIGAFIEGEKDYQVRHRWVDYPRISRQAPLAVISSEDQLFSEHWGFDLKAIDRSVRDHAQHGKKLRGASTITQQVAKNLFLWKGQSFVRKGLEVYFTVLIEAMLPKRRVLEIYLNSAEFGRGIYGVEAASRRFFRKPAARLTAPESALLAAVLPNPRRFRVEAPSAYVRQRQTWILSQMNNLGPAFLPR